jgi:flavin reductase (DIM6/NTAB) family NADH-FMN oxidoreductase RutF
MHEFKRIEPEEILVNPFHLVLKDWMLITAGPPDEFNTMTAGWGGLGALWSRNVAFCVVRPVRYTYEFLEREENFTLSWFEEHHRPALQLLGAKSGRDGDKVAESGLTPIAGILPRTTAFAEACMVLECRKIYFQDIDPANFLDPKIEEWYPDKDYHRLYVGEIVNVLAR